MNTARQSTSTQPDTEKAKATSHSLTALTVVDRNKPTLLQAELKFHSASYYLCTTHTDGFHRVQNRFLLVIDSLDDFEYEFESHFHGYIKVGKKGPDGHILKSITGSTLAVVSKISREKYDVIQSYFESSDLSLLHA
jgi:hypothetical protein